MKNLKLIISVNLVEFTEGDHDAFSKNITGHSTARVISGELRNPPYEIKSIINRELSNGFEYLSFNLSKELKNIDLQSDMKSQEDQIAKDIMGLFPNLTHVTAYWSDGVFRIGSFNVVGSWDLIVVNYPGTDIYLTNKYPSSRNKLADDTWTYGYQGASYYSEIIERVEAPIDEQILDKYFKDRRIPYKLSVYQPHPMPPIPEKNADEEYVDEERW